VRVAACVLGLCALAVHLTTHALLVNPETSGAPSRALASLSSSLPTKPWGLDLEYVRSSPRCHDRARGIMYMIGDQPTGHSSYKKRFDLQGGRNRFYAAELARAVHTARARTSLPIAIFAHLFDPPIPELNATLFGADVDCVVRGRLRLARGQCSEQVVAPLQSPFGETLLLDADTEVCADPGDAFEAMRAHDLGLVLENDAGIATKHLSQPGGVYAGEAGVRVLHEYNAGAFYFRRTEAAWAFFARAYTTQVAHEASAGPGYWTWASQELFWRLLMAPGETVRVKQLPPEFNLRQNTWARLPVLLRDHVRIVHSRLLSAPSFLSPEEQADHRAVRLRAAVDAAGGVCAWLNGGGAPRGSPQHRLLNLGLASLTPIASS